MFWSFLFFVFSLRMYRYCGLWYSWDEQSSQTSSSYREQSKHIQSGINKNADESVSDCLYMSHFAFIFSVYSERQDKYLIQLSPVVTMQDRPTCTIHVLKHKYWYVFIVCEWMPASHFSCTKLSPTLQRLSFWYCQYHCYMQASLFKLKINNFQAW